MLSVVQVKKKRQESEIVLSMYLNIIMNIRKDVHGIHKDVLKMMILVIVVVIPTIDNKQS